MQRKIVQYTRDKDGNPNGALVGVKCSEEEVIIGWSAWHTKKEDKPFNKADAVHIAVDRAKIGTNSKMPFRVQSSLSRFKERCCKYFKISMENVEGPYTERLF